MDRSEHYALVKGKVKPSRAVRVRVVSTNILNNMLNLKNNNLQKSLKYLKKFNNYVLIVIKDQNLTSIKKDLIKGNNTLRYYGIGAQIIKDLKIKNMILVTRSKKKIIGLEGFGIKISKQEIMQ